MLKRHQILLTDWLTEYVNFITKYYDMSFSEAVRLLMCFGALQAISELYPHFKPKASVKKMFKELKKAGSDRLKEDVFHRNISLVYFDARKAIELRTKCKPCK
jgi:hypothetical protein